MATDVKEQLRELATQVGGPDRLAEVVRELVDELPMTMGQTGMVIHCVEHNIPLRGTGFCVWCGCHLSMQDTYAKRM